MSMIVNVMYDGQSYWIHNENGYRLTETVGTRQGVVRFSELECFKADLVNVCAFDINISADTLVVRNDKNQYAIFSLYEDTMGYGGIYLSEEGFKYKSVFLHAERRKDNKPDPFFIVQTLYDKWIILHFVNTLSRLYPFVILCKLWDEYDSFDEVSALFKNYSIEIDEKNFLPWFFEKQFVDLNEELPIRMNGFDEELGYTPSDIRNSFIANERYTPHNIQELSPNEVFVFGSNLEGHHGGGAARLAYEKFGAVWGLGVGLAGQSYAIPTMHGGVDAIKPYVDQFIEMAKVMQDKKFYVTKIGCGIAGFEVKEMAPLFKGALALVNVALPREFVMELKK